MPLLSRCFGSDTAKPAKREQVATTNSEGSNSRSRRSLLLFITGGRQASGDGAALQPASEGDYLSAGPRCSQATANGMHPAAAKLGPSVLPSASLDVIEAIGRHLELKDRIALTSCCRKLWTRQDVRGSTALWGDVEAWFGVAKPARKHSLSQWLARHAAAASRVQLFFSSGDSSGLHAMLCALGGSALASLRVLFAPDVEQHSAAALRPLSQLQGLTRLKVSNCGLRALPQELGSLPTLQVLKWSGVGTLGEGGHAAFEPLRSATSVTRLELSWCGLLSVPEQLAALPELAALKLSWNEGLGAGGGAGLVPLRQLSGLTRLKLSCCGLTAVPSELSALSELRQLGLFDNAGLGQALAAAAAQQQGEEDGSPGGSGSSNGWEALGALTQLTWLNAGQCSLDRIPPQVSRLACLQELLLADNEHLGWEAGGFWPLLRLSALSSLNLRNCGLRAVPQLPPALTNLCLGSNRMLGGNAGGFQPLAALTSLTRLDLSSCGLRRVPGQLAGMQATLAHLELGDNCGLGAAGEVAFAPLQHLTGLTALNISECGLEVVPKPVAGLPRLRLLFLSRNAGLGQGGAVTFAPLRGLPQLERLHCARCGLERVPQDIATLIALVELDLRDNKSLGRAVGAGAPKGLEPLRSLTALTRLDLGGCGTGACWPAGLQLGRESCGR